MEEIPLCKDERQTLNKTNLIQLPIELNKTTYNLKLTYENDIITFEFVDIELIP